MKCVNCKYEGEMKPAAEKHSIKIGERAVDGTVAASKCPTCGEVYIEADAVQAFERAVAEEVLRAGAVDGATFRFLRHVVGLQAKELGPLLGVSAETLSRWEKGVRDVDRGAWLTLAMLVADRVDGRDRASKIVAAAATPRALPKKVKVA